MEAAVNALVVALALLSQAKDGHDVFGFGRDEPYPALPAAKLPPAVVGKPDPEFDRRVAELRKAVAAKPAAKPQLPVTVQPGTVIEFRLTPQGFVRVR